MTVRNLINFENILINLSSLRHVLKFFRCHDITSERSSHQLKVANSLFVHLNNCNIATEHVGCGTCVKCAFKFVSSNSKNSFHATRSDGPLPQVENSFIKPTSAKL